MRLITVFLIVTLCGYAAARGWEVAEFATAQMPLRRDNDSEKASADRFREWIDAAGVAGAAREALLVQETLDASPVYGHRRADELISLLEARPLASVDWLSLAGARVVSGAAEEQVLSALTMSRISGPNEGAVMLQRGIFGLLRWETFPEDVRAQLAHDLAGALLEGSIGGDAISVIRGVLAAKPGDVRSQIGVLLETEQVPERRLAQIGL